MYFLNIYVNLIGFNRINCRFFIVTYLRAERSLNIRTSLSIIHNFHLCEIKLWKTEVLDKGGWFIGFLYFFSRWDELQFGKYIEILFLSLNKNER